MSSFEFSHVPVMLHEAVDGLNIRPDGVYVDCTTGGGGHSFEIASRLDGGRLICFDRDPDAIEAAKKRLRAFNDKVTFVNRNFCDIIDVLNGERVDGVLIDLGVSSYQLDNPERGFSYMRDAYLDMRMNQTEGISAYDVVNSYSREELVRIFRDYGEERFASRIASAIVSNRENKPISTTHELAKIAVKAIPGATKNDSHPEKRIFQAIRIEVNGELEIIPPTVRSITASLRPGGRISVITFHSLEDRLVKQTYAELAKGCTCPPKLPVCVCGKKPQLKLCGKAILPSAEELAVNSRSASAKLRVAEKI
ncbi:MAG: 16S rRNA (cytosine(1402)-N(4))-methyltransferase RsmH [Clostridia bacterium]|nr:16S rRNA (cytosine(1402)-N(4))-methyltransferase RsmH [Clostridia bacterium]